MSEQTFTYTNETFSGCDMVAQIVIRYNTVDENGKTVTNTANEILGTMQTVSYSINMDKSPVRSIGNVNAKDYVMGQRTIAGSLVFSVFNRHFSRNIMEKLNANYAGVSFLADEIPPFDIVISAANEYGYRSRIVIYGVRLLNEGQVMSINDVYTENTYQYYATDIEYLTDEMSYTKSNTGKRYILSDNISYYPNNSNSVFYNSNLSKEREAAEENYWNNIANEAIKLSYNIKQPTTKKGNGIVDLFLVPGQSSGVIYISSNSGNNDKTINITADTTDSKHNTKNFASIKLPPDTYYAYFISQNNIRSNDIIFKVNEYSGTKSYKEIIPVIDELTPNSVTIFCSKDSHNKAVLYDSKGEKKEYDIKDNYVKIKKLKADSKYTLKTYSEESGSVSVTISFKTPMKNKLYDNLIFYLKSNAKALNIKNIAEWVNLIRDNEDLDISPYMAIFNAKRKYTNELSTLDVNSSNYFSKREELEEKILICSKILLIAEKLSNDYLTAINEKNNVPVPVMFYDENYNNVFQFDKYIDTAEFYRDYGTVKQLNSTVKNTNFSTICDHENSFRYLGKGGLNHYVQAMINNVRSAKLNFYVMTNKEKNDCINSGFINNGMDDGEKNKIDDIINNQDVSDADRERTFIYNAKKISYPKIINPSILDINADEIIVESNIYDFINNDYNTTFYLAIASYTDIVNKDSIYKIEFNNYTDYISIPVVYSGIKNDTAYGIWIEDSDGTQISNVSTFIYNEDNELNLNTNYELSTIYNEIYEYANTYLSKDLEENMEAELSNNEDKVPNETITRIVSLLNTSVVNKDSLLSFLYKLKYYIGVLGESSNVFNNVKYESTILTFNTDISNLNAIVYSNNNIQNYKVDSSFSLDLSSIKSNLVLIILSDSNLMNKSNLIIINKSDNYFEVI